MLRHQVPTKPDFWQNEHRLALQQIESWTLKNPTDPGTGLGRLT